MSRLPLRHLISSIIAFCADISRNANPKFSGELFEVYRAGAQKIKDFSDSIGRPMNEVALNWLRQKEEITSIIGGASTIAQLEKNIHCTSWDLSDEELQHLEVILEPFRMMP